MLPQTTLIRTTAKQIIGKRRDFLGRIHHHAGRTNLRVAGFSSVAKLGLGSTKWSQIEGPLYQEMVARAIDGGYHVLEAGPEGGDQALLDGYSFAMEYLPNPPKSPPIVVSKIGYRPVGETSEEFFGDVEQKNNVPIMHNISPAYIKRLLRKSPLVQKYQEMSDNLAWAFRYVPLLHNPESQVLSMDQAKVSVQDRQDLLRESIANAFCSLEWAVSQNMISSYGVSSNGLILPPEHPLHLSPTTLVEATHLAKEKVQEEDWYDKKGAAAIGYMSTVQLPINLLERNGLEVAKEIHEKTNHSDMWTQQVPLDVHATRPLRCYPDRGTGTGHSFHLVDYELPISEGVDQEPKMQWTNEMEAFPLLYQVALKTAIAHFDAEEILQVKQDRDLTTDERETLDGCKLLQSMLHDLDNGLDNIRSFDAHENELYERIIPLIHDTFETYDEVTADVLEAFFKSYSMAVRHAIAKNTRSLLKEGGDDKSFEKLDIPKDMKLQEFALRFLLEQPYISTVVVGSSTPKQVMSNVQISNSIHPDERTKEQ